MAVNGKCINGILFLRLLATLVQAKNKNVKVQSRVITLGMLMKHSRQIARSWSLK